VENPPLGSSGIRITFPVEFMLEGFRPGRLVRVRHGSWPDKVELPASEVNRSDNGPDVFQPKKVPK